MKATILITIGLFLVLSCQFGHTLMCYKCDNFACKVLRNETCSLGLDSCYTKIIGSGLIKITQRGCTIRKLCPILFGSTSCCYSDLCNSNTPTTASPAATTTAPPATTTTAPPATPNPAPPANTTVKPHTTKLKTTPVRC
ncbi:three-finger toxin MALT0058C-like [Ascaphus truei]|uniref:three-finger toxin MALT0058C-like n=1 Tax=Ascaphus truei TaxID=8439 RepID=UPI003F59664C